MPGDLVACHAAGHSVALSTAPCPVNRWHRKYSTIILAGTASYRRMRCLHCSTQHSIAEKTLIACVSQFLGKIHDTSDPDLLLSAETMGDRSAIERNIAALKDRLADIADRMRKLVNLYVTTPTSRKTCLMRKWDPL